MNKTPYPQKRLVILSTCILILIACCVVRLAPPDLPPAVDIQIEGQPTIGYLKAPVRIVVFEEPKCSNCRLFNQQIYPLIKQEFIDTQKVNYTVIPVSFLPGSMPAAMALLCVYNGETAYPNADLYFSYLDYLYTHQPGETVDWATSENLLKYAEGVSPAISTPSLKQCILKQTFREQIQKNTEYGKQLMGGDIATPTLFVNGIEAKELSFDAIKTLIEDVGKQGGSR